MGDIEFWVVFVIVNSIKLQKMIKKISWVTNSHLGPTKQVTIISFENSMPKCNILQYFKTLGIFHHKISFFGKVNFKKRNHHF